MNMASKLTRNLSQWPTEPCRLTGSHMITRIMAVSLIVQTVTNLATGSRDVGQKVVEPKGKDHAKRRNNRKRRTTRQRGSIKRKGKTERTRPYTMTRMTNPEHQILHTWQPHFPFSIPLDS